MMTYIWLAICGGLILLNIFFVFFIGILLMKTPAWTYFQAWYKKRKIMIIFFKEKMYKIVSVKDDGSALETKHGIFFKTEDSVCFDVKTKTATFFGFSRFAGSMPVEFPALIQELRDNGVSLTTFKDYKQAISKNPDMELHISPLKTIKMHEVTKMFPFNLNPSLVAEKISVEIQKRNKIMGGFINPTTLLIASAIAGAIIIVTIWLLMGGKCDCNCIAEGFKGGIVATRNITG